MVAAISACAAAVGAILDRSFGGLNRRFRDHEIANAADFAEMRASVAALARDQVGVENRLSIRLDAIDKAIHGVTARIDRILEGK